jgi:hypothetical protein
MNNRVEIQDFECRKELMISSICELAGVVAVPMSKMIPKQEKSHQSQSKLSENYKMTNDIMCQVSGGNFITRNEATVLCRTVFKF